MSFEFVKKILNSVKKFDSDVEDYKKLVKTPSVPSAAYVNWAVHLVEIGEFELAEEKLISSTQFAQTPEAYINLGLLRVKERKFDEAKEFYTKALRLDNNSSKAYCFLANVLTEMQDYELAEKNFEKSESIDKGNPDILLNWGLFYLRQKKFEQAKEKFQKANRISGINLNSVYFLGLIDMEQQNFDKAVEKFEMIVSADSSHHEAYYYLAYIFYTQKKYEKSIANALKSLSIFPKKIETYMLLAENYMKSNDKDECLKYYVLGEQECGVNYFFLTSWGLSMQHFSMFEESKEKFEKAIEINDSQELAYNCLGIANFELKDFEKAISFFEKVVELMPDNAIALDNLGQIYLDNENYEKAIEYFQTVLKVSAKNVLIYEKLARTYHLAGDIKKSEEYYEKAIEYSPDNIRFYLDYAQILLEQKKYEQALKKLQKVYKLDAENLNCLNLLFYVNYLLAKKNGSDYNIEKAIVFAEEIIKIYPDKFKYSEEKKELEEKKLKIR